jgi:hypothetical protein
MLRVVLVRQKMSDIRARDFEEKYIDAPLPTTRADYDALRKKLSEAGDLLGSNACMIISVAEVEG